MNNHFRNHRKRKSQHKINNHIIHRQADELLELIWTLDEEDIHDVEQIHIHLNEPGVDKTLTEMEASALITITDNTIKFTQEGFERAKQIIRRHRLAERLLSEVLRVNEDIMEASACNFEHILNEEVTDSICTLLGHPPTCPHGKAIPRGECCKKYDLKVKPLLVRLSELSPGQDATIAFISPRYHSRLDRLGSFGIIPGTKIHLHQKEPAPVIQVGETDLAIEKEIADEIYVRFS